MATDQEALDQYLVGECLEDYQERRVSRREALKVIAAITGSSTLATALLAACSPAPPAPQATQAPTSQPPSPTARPPPPSPTINGWRPMTRP